MKFPGLKTTFILYFLCLNKLISQSHNLSFCHVQRKTNKQTADCKAVKLEALVDFSSMTLTDAVR